MQNKDEKTVGLIHEIGDMGLGFDEIQDEGQQKKIQDELKKHNERKSKEQ